MEERSRFWDTFWSVAPLILGAVVGFLVASQFPATSPGQCGQTVTPPSTGANFALAVILVGLVVGRLIARQAIGPVAAHAFTMAALGLVVAACGSFFIGTRSGACPPTGVASGHEAMVRISHAQLHLS